MAGFFVVALAIPQAFNGSDATFGLAYLGVVLINMGMFARSSQMTAVAQLAMLVGLFAVMLAGEGRLATEGGERSGARR